MNGSDTTVFGDYIEPDAVDYEGSLTFSIKAAYIEKRVVWKSKDITAEFLGNFWENMLENQDIKSTLHFVCAELMENAVYHSMAGDYMVRINLCFSREELLVYVMNIAEAAKMEDFKIYIRTLLETENLQKLFIKRMKEAKKQKSSKSQLGLITILKDRGAKLAWKIEHIQDTAAVTTLARIPVKGKEPL